MKIKKLSIFVLIFILCLSGCAGTKKVKYQSGRDTYLSVGDGRFQMMSSFDYTIYDLLSISTFYLGEIDESLKWVDKAIKMEPNNKRLLNNKKLILRSKKEF